MKVEQRVWKDGRWTMEKPNEIADRAQLVLFFGERNLLKDKAHIEEVRQFYPKAEIIGCSTSGEIAGDQVNDNSMVATAVYFEQTRIQTAHVCMEEGLDGFKVGEQLASALNKEGLVHILVLSRGLNINGSDLARGLADYLPQGIVVTGGLAGDQARFEETVTLYNDDVQKDMVVAVGFYGSKLRVGYGSMGGWDSFGLDRLITKSKGNVLYELDGKPALDLYKLYLGERAKDLPASGLHFPLSLRLKGSGASLVRTILSVKEADKSVVFAGDVPEGQTVRLMKANAERLVDGASGAAQMSVRKINLSRESLAVLVSCVGRKLVLKQRVEEEIESVKEVMGDNAVLTGFYSYGEICPVNEKDTRCELHNQTMTITVFCEES